MTEQTKAAFALSLLEVVEHVFQHITEPSDVYRALQVNKVWRDAAIPQLYKRVTLYLLRHGTSVRDVCRTMHGPEVQVAIRHAAYIRDLTIEDAYLSADISSLFEAARRLERLHIPTWAKEISTNTAPFSLSRVSSTISSLTLNCDLPKAGQLLQLLRSIPNAVALQELYLFNLLPRETEGLTGVVQQLGASVRSLRLQAYVRPPYTGPWPQAAQWRTLFHHLSKLEILDGFLPGNTCYDDPSVFPPTVKHLRLSSGSYIGSFRLLEALVHPAFLPQLREVPRNLFRIREHGLGVRDIGVAGAQELEVIIRACRTLHTRGIDLKANEEAMAIALDRLMDEVEEEENGDFD